MQDLISKLQQHVEAGIKNYEGIFKNKKISERRARDISNIRKLLYQPHYDLDFKMKSIKKYLKHMQTGWGIFKTGHSILKNNILSEIKTFKKKYVNQSIAVPQHHRFYRR